jgi:predicted Zn-dependent peptidase
MIHGHVMSLEEIQARIDRVTLDCLKRVAAATFATAPTLSTVGPASVVLSADDVAQSLGHRLARAVGA